VVQADLLYCVNKLDGSRNQCGRSCLEQSISQKRKKSQALTTHILILFCFIQCAN
jgi:hypothetical protein